MDLVNVHSNDQLILINKDMLTNNQLSEPVKDQNLHGLAEIPTLQRCGGTEEITRPGQDQDYKSQEQTCSVFCEIEVIGERSEETTGDSWLISLRDKLDQAHRDDDTTIWGELCMETLTEVDQPKLMNGQEKSLDILDDKGKLHCLDVFRQSLLQSNPTPNQRSRLMRLTKNTYVVDKRLQQLVDCVTELRGAGVKFRRRNTDRFWDIQFKNGYLEIPKLLIHDGGMFLRES
ncbi:hypothetical protein ISN44_As03g041650 [Arabidopsis suecica]|uniref:Uncharacterized protein n=1 Tax=Arabidopsis suecica TaxID=45249 RepID=A0A8T2FER9_ARASU|nr:hypothetical protein ISN44_As03g041650 [Arabidopsis suecica]